MGFWLAVSALLTCLVGGAVFFARGNRPMRLRHATFGRVEVESALRCVLDDTERHDAFDLFLAWPINDPYFESIRKQRLQIVRMSPPPRRGEDVSESGKDQIRALFRDLRERA
jgi:hypothetical protein